MVIITNVVNIVLDVLFVIGLGWKVEGAALASVIADYSGCAFGLWCVWRTWSHRQLPAIRSLLSGVANDIGRFCKTEPRYFSYALFALQATF